MDTMVENSAKVQLELEMNNELDVEPTHRSKVGDETRKQAMLSKLLDKDSRTLPPEAITMIGLCWVVLVVTQYMKTAADQEGWAECGTFGWWILALASLPFFVFVANKVGDILGKQTEERLACGFEYLEGDMKWTKKNCRRYSGLVTGAGIAAGLLGIGGGMVQGPLMLEMGIDSQVSAGSAATMIFFTASNVMVQFMLFDVISGTAAFQFGLIGMAGAFIGQKGLKVVLNKYKRISIITYSLGIVIGASALLMGITGIIKVSEDIKTGEHLGFTSICTSGGGH